MDIAFDKGNSIQPEPDRLHLQNVPVSINYNGPSEINKYFTPYIHSDETEKEFESSFRGTQLSGEKIIVPNEHSIVILKDCISKSGEKILKEKGRTKSFLLWKSDARSHSGSILKQAFRYIDDAKEIHL